MEIINHSEKKKRIHDSKSDEIRAKSTLSTDNLFYDDFEFYIRHDDAPERRRLARRKRMAAGELLGKRLDERLVVVDLLAALRRGTPLGT